jgi:Fis family transcriptional regulator
MTYGNKALVDPGQRERRRQPLSSAVRVALELYFRSLDGHDVTDLHQRMTEEFERPLLEAVMKHSGGNQSRAARMLGLNRGTLRKKLTQYGLD